MHYYLSKLPNHFLFLIRSLHPTTVTQRKDVISPFLLQLVAKILKSTNEMFHSKTSPLKEGLPECFVFHFFLFVLYGGGLVVITPVSCRMLCQSNVSHYCFICVLLLACLLACRPCGCGIPISTLLLALVTFNLVSIIKQIMG